MCRILLLRRLQLSWSSNVADQPCQKVPASYAKRDACCIWRIRLHLTDLRHQSRITTSLPSSSLPFAKRRPIDIALSLPSRAAVWSWQLAS